MLKQEQTHRIFRALGICSPYLAVLAGVFILKNGLLAVLLYHAVLLVCIIAINKIHALKLLIKGCHGCVGPLICLGGLLPAVVIIYFWPLAKLPDVNLSEVFSSLNLNKQLFGIFAVYSCIVNPFMEESFWRGCFKNNSLFPAPVDMLFAAYPALVIYPVVKLPFVVLLFAALTFVGWLFRTLYNFTGGLLIPLMTHIIADIAILYAIWKIMQ
ncbi:MAG: CPBP family glutamic-type intramembrane protease [Planctomycetota bacterium]|jgi:membrane protease YdiL (CAAX protease family)